MSHIIKFDPTKRKSAQNKTKPKKTAAQKETPNRETVLLWRVSEAIDEVLKDAILNQNLNAREVAAILAHRLGTLIQTTEAPHELLQFCEQVMAKLNPKPEHDPNSSAS